MKQLSHANTFLRQIHLSPLSALHLSAGKRLLIVMLSYVLGASGLWLLFPFQHSGILLFVPFVCACWLFRYRGLLISFVLNVVAFHLFLLWGMLPDWPFARMEIFGLLGISLALGLLVCWLQKRANQAAHALLLAQKPEHEQTFHSTDQVRPIEEQLSETNEGLQPPPIVLAGSLASREEQQIRLEQIVHTDVLTEVIQQEAYLGRRVGEYRLVRKLGGGTFGTIYLAEHGQEHRLVAVKVLHIMTRSESLKDFLNEACMMWLRHPHIVPLLDFGISPGDIPFLVMEYAPRGSLRDRHLKGEHVPLPTIVSYVDQLSSALQYAHDQHVIHRDVKPANILVRTDGTLMLSDFGVAKLLEHDVVSSQQTQVGTPVYMAPEQYEGYPCFASDQYALAVIVYEWICGIRPFQGPTISLAFQHINTSPPRLRDRVPDLPETIEHVILKGLAKNPVDRFERVEAFADALRKAAQPSIVLDTSFEVTVNTAPAFSSEQVSTQSRSLKSEPLVRVPQIARTSTEALAKDSPQPSLVSALAYQNRMRLLQRVRSFWITGVLEQSLHGMALLTLSLQEQPSAVANPWQPIMQESERASTPVPLGTPITEVYDKADGELLILGEPGSGKTTSLLSLARDLLERAEQEQTHPIPVIFNLSSWTHRRQPLSTWLIEELETKYKVSKNIGSDWINTNQILPLLDGLDEVDAPYRAACMQTIDEYHRAHSLVPLVLCCRMNEYLAQRESLSLSHAVTIQPLTTNQVNHYFARSGERLTSLRNVFQHDPALQELATTPLMLSILIQAYQGLSVEEIKGRISAEGRPPHIFATYTQRMLSRRSAKLHYGLEQTIHWLSLLARQMKQQSQSVFYIERMQPGWLTKQWQRRLYYGLIAGPICGLFVGLESLGTILSFPLVVLITALLAGLLFGWVSEPGTAKKSSKAITHKLTRIRQRLAAFLESRVKIGIVAGSFIGLSSLLYLFLGDYNYWPLGSRILGALTTGLLSGLLIGVCVGLTVRLERRIEPMEGWSWSWRGIGKGSVRWLLAGIGLIVGLMFAVPFMVSSHDVWLGYFLATDLSIGLTLVFVVMLVSGVTRGLSKRVLDEQQIVTPNQGTWRSARYGLVMGLITGGFTGIFSGSSDFVGYFWLPLHTGFTVKMPLGIDSEAVNIIGNLLGTHPTSTMPEFWLLHAFFWGLVDAAIPALAVGLACGGAAYIQHFVLRSLLWCTHDIPFDYARFLDYASERILLRKVGGGYIFIHKLLLEYFADLDVEAIHNKT